VSGRKGKNKATSDISIDPEEHIVEDNEDEDGILEDWREDELQLAMKESR
jgi:hypothetical protein